MATADVSIDADIELEEIAREQRDKISLCFSEARKRLDEREAQLYLQLEEKMNQSKVHNKNLAERKQLNSLLELMQANATLNSLQDVINESVKPIKDKLKNLEKEEAYETTVQYDWSPQKLYTEISEIGKVATIPAPIQSSCISEYNTREEMIIKRVIPPPPYEQQKQEINSLLRKPLQNREYRYLIHIRWYKQWTNYVGYDKCDNSIPGMELDKPGPIDNTSLLDQDKLRRHLAEEIDYKLVPDRAWYKLLSWYGISEGSMGIRRQVVEYGKFVKHCKVEIYPLELKACLHPYEAEFTIVTISRYVTIHTLENKIREVYNIDSTKQTRISYRYKTNTYELIVGMNLEVLDGGLFDGQLVLIEVQNVDGTWPRRAAYAKN